MKTLKTIFASTILCLAIGVQAYAGDVNTPAGPAPPPATCSDCETSVSQIEPSDTTLSPETATFDTSEFAVELMMALLSFC